MSRFERAARLLASLNHPNIATIYGLEHSGESQFLVLELVPGDTLAERIQRGPIPVAEAFRSSNRWPKASRPLIRRASSTAT